MARPTRKAKIESLLRNLPILPGRDERVPSLADDILIAHMFGKSLRSPRARPGRLKDSVRGTEIRQLAKLAGALGLHISKMHKDALERVDRHMGAGLHPVVLMYELNVLIAASSRALDLTQKLNPAPRGRPKSELARFVACRTAVAFLALTGARPGYTTDPISGAKSGRFVSLVASIFLELDIVENPAEWAEVACLSLRKDGFLPT